MPCVLLVAKEICVHGSSFANGLHILCDMNVRMGEV